jgi:F420-dependent oxidoreductase-like protein
LRLGLNLGYAGVGSTELVVEAEQLGYDSVWAAEAWGYDAVTVLAWLAARTERIHLGSAVLQMPARTPAMTAMTAYTLDELSGGRLRLGLGLSGPQVVEGWHGVPYGKPLGKTREYVSIVRRVLQRRTRLEHNGEHYQIPYGGPDATGLGKPLMLIGRPIRPDLPIYLASIGPKNVALTAEIADGWLPVFFSPDHAHRVFWPNLEDGFARSGKAQRASSFDVAPTVSAIITDDLDYGRAQVKPLLALYVGGMGARSRNFYNDLAGRYGFEREAGEIQDLYLAGKKKEAIARVPDALVDLTSLVGPREMVRDRLEAWEEAGVTSLLVGTTDLVTLRTLAELLL